MARARMISKKISVSEDVANQSVEAQLIFTWSIAHTDDVGLLPYSLKTLKALIVPMLDMDFATFNKHAEALIKADLWRVFTHGSEKFILVPKFAEYQELRKDKYPQSILQVALPKNPREAWEFLEETVLSNHSSVPAFHKSVSEVKRSEEKGSEEKIERLSPRAQTELFFKSVEAEDAIFETFINQLQEKNPKSTAAIIAQEIKRFVDYWTELNHTGTKARWQQQKTFEVRRRLKTWFDRAGFRNFATGQASGKGRAIIS